MHTMTLAETKFHLSVVVDQVQAGEEIVITRRGGPDRDSAAPAKESQVFVLAQAMAEDNGVIAMRDIDRY